MRVKRQERRLAQRDRCAVGLVNQQPTSYLWMTSRMREFPRLELPLAAASVFVYKTFTLPKLRGGGLSHAVIMWALAEYARLGYHRAFMDIGIGNRPSLRVAEKAGFVEVGRFTIITIAGQSFTRMASELSSRVSRDPY